MLQFYAIITVQMNSIDLPFYVIRMTQVMPLTVFLHIVEDHHSCHEVNDFPSWQQMQITSTIPAPVTVNPVEFQFALGRCADFVKVVGLH